MSLDLNIGMILAVLKLSGNVDDDMQQLKMSARGAAITGAAILINFRGGYFIECFLKDSNTLFGSKLLLQR